MVRGDNVTCEATMLDGLNFRLPEMPLFLEEVNLPKTVARHLAGQTVTVRVLPEEQASTRQLEVPDDYPVIVKPDSTVWNDFRSVRILLRGDDGGTWRLPRHWLYELPPSLAIHDPLRQGLAWVEELNLPHAWDLLEVNIPARIAARCSGAITKVFMKATMTGPAEVYWRDPEESVWRIPASWRRRRIMLPNVAIMMEPGVPDSIAQTFAHKIVSVNYHPGSLCCLAEHFRFRDDDGGKWPVRITECTVVRFGNGPECSV